MSETSNEPTRDELLRYEAGGNKAQGYLSKGSGIVPAHALEVEHRPLHLESRPAGADIVPIKFNGPGDAPTTTTIDYGGGPTLGGGPVNLIFWGTAWNTTPPPNPSIATVVNDIAQILSGPYLSSASQYGATPMRLGNIYLVTSPNPPSTFTIDDVSNLVGDLQGNGTLTGPYNGNPFTLHCVMMPPGAAPQKKGVVGEHTNNRTTIFDRSTYVGWVLYTTRAGISQIFSHELVESCTDPEGDGTQVNPADSSNWHEIADVCASVGIVNGVSVQSYWSQSDKACIIPMDIPVNKQITCIHKAPRSDPHHSIDLVGGITIETGEPFLIKQFQCIEEIDHGNTFFVVGSDGSRADVKVFIHFPPWAPQGSRYIATVADTSLEDNLLSLPNCPYT